MITYFQFKCLLNSFLSQKRPRYKTEADKEVINFMDNFMSMRCAACAKIVVFHYSDRIRDPSGTYIVCECRNKIFVM